MTKTIEYDTLLAHYEAMGIQHAIPSYAEVVEYPTPNPSSRWWWEDIRDVVPIPGPVQFISEHDGFWGDGEDYVSEVVYDARWDDIMLMADAMIMKTGDFHHVFLEAVHITDMDKWAEEGGYIIATMQMGS